MSVHVLRKWGYDFNAGDGLIMRKRFGYDGDEQRDDPDINMTPMLDVIFILLIFFVVSASFVKEAGITVDRPRSDTAVLQDHASIVIAISAAGEVWINHRRIDVRAVAANVERLYLENPQSSVLVAADQASQNGVLVKVLDGIRKAGVEKIAIVADDNN